VILLLNSTQYIVGVQSNSRMSSTYPEKFILDSVTATSRSHIARLHKPIYL